jgi:hypothetical protein
MSDDELTNGERLHRMYVDLDLLLDLSEEDWQAARVEAAEIGGQEATAGGARQDQRVSELRDVLARAAELRRSLGK